MLEPDEALGGISVARAALAPSGADGPIARDASRVGRSLLSSSCSDANMRLLQSSRPPTILERAVHGEARADLPRPAHHTLQGNEVKRRRWYKVVSSMQQPPPPGGGAWLGHVAKRCIV